MAAYDIHRHFKALRADTGRRRGRPDPWATGFEDDSEDEKKTQRAKQPDARNKSTSSLSPPATTPSSTTKNPVPAKPPTGAANSTRSRASSSPLKRHDSSDDDNFLSYQPKRRIERKVSPAPLQLAASNTAFGAAGRRRPSSKDSRVLAVGNLAYLDDSESDGESQDRLQARQRRDRRPSPAPGRRSPGPESPPLSGRSSSRTHRDSSSSAVPRHTVASPFAGTKYLQDSDTESDEEAILSQRSGSQDSTANTSADTDPTDLLSPVLTQRKQQNNNRSEKAKSPGSGVSWQTISAGRTEQRNAELQTLRTNLQKRGKSISFKSHVTTDDGQRIPLGRCCSEGKQNGARGRGRERSPPRTQEDVGPSRDEINDAELTAILTQHPTQSNQHQTKSEDQIARQDHFQTSEFSMSPTSEALAGSLVSSNSPPSPSHSMHSSIDALTTRLASSPQMIPESKAIDHTIDQTVDPLPPPLSSTGALAQALQSASLNRNPSTRSIRSGRPARMNSGSRRQSRRSTSYTSQSPAQAFLASFHRDTGADAAPESKPDDEGQSIGLQNEYIIGRTINQGGFGVVKEVRTINERTGHQESFAVKIVRNLPQAVDSGADDKVQQDLEHEVSVWRHLKHPNILALRAVYETEYATFCVMDLNVGGTLFDLVRKQRQAAEEGASKGLEPKLARHYAFQLASALRYLHEDLRVCHRDVKLENCLIDTSDPESTSRGGTLRLCDFGLADFLHTGSMDEGEEAALSDSEDASAPASRSSRQNTTSSVIGTLEYASPKGLSVHRKLFETAGDIWAYGVVVYALCTGELPFRHPLPSKTVDAILKAEWSDTALRQVSTSGVGDDVCELVHGCLEKDIDLRWTIADCMRSPWFRNMSISTNDDGQSAWR